MQNKAGVEGGGNWQGSDHEGIVDRIKNLGFCPSTTEILGKSSNKGNAMSRVAAWEYHWLQSGEPAGAGQTWTLRDCIIRNGV